MPKKTSRSIAALCLLFFSFICQAQDQILVMKIRDEIDPRMSRYVDLAIQEAKKPIYKALIIDMDTYGGRVDDADKIRKLILAYPKPSAVYINKNAASAGALISIACQKIYMESGATIGAATVVQGEDGKAAPDKYQSYMRGMMRSTAETRGRNPQIAEAMVDQSLVLDSTIKKNNKVITFTTKEAIQHGFCDAELKTIDEATKAMGFGQAVLKSFELGASEKWISMFLNPAVSSILILVMLGGLYFELQSPGIGFPLIAAIIAAILYFTPYYLNGLAANWEILVFILGIALLAAEIFVIPGFGVVGIAGLCCIFASLLLVMLNNTALDFSLVYGDDLLAAGWVVALAIAGSIALLLFGSQQITKTAYFKKVSLSQTLDSMPLEVRFKHSMVGHKGKAISALRPMGTIQIEHQRYEAQSWGAYIDAGKDIWIIEQRGQTLVVSEEEPIA